MYAFICTFAEYNAVFVFMTNLPIIKTHFGMISKT